MTVVADIFVVIVAFLHIYFLVLEMFLWTKPLGLKTFRQTPAQAQSTAVLAGNQGLYNGFLSAGLVWGLLHPNLDMAWQIKAFFLACVVVAGVYGAYSVNKRIFFVQSLPAILGLIFLAL